MVKYPQRFKFRVKAVRDVAYRHYCILLCIEPFAHRIRIDKNIIGLKLPGTIEEARISQYADDTDIVVCN